MRNFTLTMCFIATMLFFAGGMNAVELQNSDKTIVLLTNPDNGNDDAQYAWLMANGFKVFRIDVQSAKKTANLDAPSVGFRDTLDNADLVIVGRNAHLNSLGVLDDILVPVIAGNAFGARWSDPKLWFENGDMNVLSGKTVWMTIDKADPIFQFCKIVGDSINFTRLTGFITKVGTHSGKVIGSKGSDIGIVRFPKDVPYNGGAGAITPKSEHTVFSFNEDNGKSLSLNADGVIAYYGEIRHALGMSIEPPKVMTGSASERNVVLLTNPDNGNDADQVVWLTKNGFVPTVIDVQSSKKKVDLDAPSAGFRDTLNAADVVIVGRNAHINTWGVLDEILTPVISSNAFGARWSTPKLWFEDGDMNVQSGKKVWMTIDKADAIFQFCKVIGDSINFSTETGFVTNVGTHSGTVIGSKGADIGIVRFPKDVPYNGGVGAITPKSQHTIYSFSEGGGKKMSLNPDGQIAYYAEISRMAGLPIAAPAFIYYDNSLKTIVVPTEDAHGGDVAIIDFLQKQGFAVTKLLVNDKIIELPSAGFMDTLNNADLIAYGRDAWSNVQQAFDATTTPVIHSNLFGAQWASPDKFWFLNASMLERYETTKIKVVADPIFANSHVKNDSIEYTGPLGAGFIQTSDAHNGTVIGYGPDNSLAIVRFAKNVPYNASLSAKTPKSDHTLFPFQTGPKAMSLTCDAQAAYYGEIRRLMGSSIEAPVCFVNPSKVATLSNIVPSVGVLDPAFSSQNFYNDLTVPAGTASVTLTATTTDAKATVVDAGLILITENPQLITVTVTAEDGVTQEFYDINIITLPVAVNELAAAGLSVYPNPAKDQITVGGLQSIATITITSASGNIVSKVTTVGKVDISSLSSGLYLIKIEVDGKSYQAKIVKQ